MHHPYRIAVLASVSLLLSAAAVAADGAPPAATPAVEKVVVRAQARFDFDKATLHPEDAAKILAELGKVGNVTWQAVEATGYTDSIGSDAYNEALSKRRAAAVKAFLVSKGVDRGMVATAGMAEADPVADNSTAQGRAQNRRTEVEFHGVRVAGN